MFASQEKLYDEAMQFAVVLLLALATASRAGSGWTALFNGKDLSGWKKNGDEKWVVGSGDDSLREHSEQVRLLNDRKDVWEF